MMKMKMSTIVFAGLLFLMGGCNKAKAQVEIPFGVVGVGSQKVQVTTDKMTNLIFPVAIRTGIKVSREIAVQKVKGVDNVLELKALRRGFAVTNLSVFGMNGKLYCFDLEFSDSPSVLTFKVVDSAGNDAFAFPGGHPIMLTGLPSDISSLRADADTLSEMHGFLHNSAKGEKLRVQVKGIYLKEGLMWLVIRVKNNSSVDYRPDYIRLSIEDRRKVKRMAVQEITVDPIFTAVPTSIPGKSSRRFAIGYLPFTIGKNKQLQLSIAEENGGREVVMVLKSKAILSARVE